LAGNSELSWTVKTTGPAIVSTVGHKFLDSYLEKDKRINFSKISKFRLSRDWVERIENLRKRRSLRKERKNYSFFFKTRREVEKMEHFFLRDPNSPASQVYLEWKSNQGKKVIRHYDPKFNMLSVKGFDENLTETKFDRSERVEITKKFCKEKGRFIRRARIPESVRKSLPITPGPALKWIGEFPFPVGVHDQKVIKPSLASLDYLYLAMQEGEFKKPLTSLPLRYTVMPSWVSQQREFQGFSVKTEETYRAKELLNIIQPHLVKLSLPSIPDIPLGYVDNVETKKDSFAGTICQLILGGKRTHGNSDRYLRPIAKRLYSNVRDGRILVDQSIWSIGGRARVQKFEQGDSLKSRIVLMPEGVPKILAMCFAQPIYEEFIRMNKSKKDLFKQNEILVGFDFLYQRFFKWQEMISDYQYYLEGDMKRFDQNNGRETIIAAFSILRSCYPDSEEIDNVFTYFLNGFLYKNIAVPGGFIYRWEQGIPSGSPFTTIIGCLCNWINLTVLMETLHPGKMWKLVVYGDDFLIFHNFYSSFSQEDYIRVLRANSGYIADPFLKRDHIPDSPFTRQPVLLKTASFNGMPGRNTEDVLEKVFFESRKSSSLLDRAKRITGTFYNAPFNFDAMRIVNSFRDILFTKSTPWSPDNWLYKRFIGIRAYDISLRAGGRNYLIHPESSSASKSPLPWVGGEGFVPTTYDIPDGMKGSVNLLEVISGSHNPHSYHTLE
jgi:hypothetical protein